MIERRRFLSLAAGVFFAAAAPAVAQPAATTHRIGILGNAPLTDPEGARLWGAFGQGLRDLGWTDGGNLTIEHRSSEGQYDKLPALAAELGRLKVDGPRPTGTRS